MTHTIQVQKDGVSREVNVTILAQRDELCECVYADDDGALRYVTLRADELMPTSAPPAPSLAQRIGAPWWWRDVRQHPGAFAGMGLGAIIFLSALLPVGNSAAPQPSAALPAASATPALAVPMARTYARVLDAQREAYAEPGGAFLGAIEAGRGYAPLHDDVDGWSYVHVEDAGPVWLIDPTPAPQLDAPHVVEQPAPFVPTTAPHVVEYVPAPEPTVAPVADLTAKHSGPSKIPPWEGGKHPDDPKKEGP